ncbi:MAG: hypothetical protein ACLSD7_01015 [Coprococcus phoceensis]
MCNSKNANGNTLDLAVIEQIKLLEDDKGFFIDQLEQSRKFYTGNRAAYEDQLASIRHEKEELEKKLKVWLIPWPIWVTARLGIRWHDALNS